MHPEKITRVIAMMIFMAMPVTIRIQPEQDTEQQKGKLICQRYCGQLILANIAKHQDVN